MTTVLVPHLDHPAIEERYAAWQTRALLGASGAAVRTYDPIDAARDVGGEVDDDDVVVVTDPLLLPSPNLVPRLVATLNASAADAVVPVSNVAAHPRQRREIAPYLTLRELQSLTAQLEAAPLNIERVAWDASDPLVYAFRTVLLDESTTIASRALRGADVAVSGNDFVHRWPAMRGFDRADLLDRIGRDARTVLELGCGEGTLGAALKQRQTCRVVGIELDRHAAAVARRRIDDVYSGDVREIVDILDEQFDWIIGGDVVEHLDDPWSFLAALRNITAPGGRLLLSLPNIATASVVADLLAGRFDYVYMGLTCVGHLRFFTCGSIEQMLSMAGWSAERIERQETIPTFANESLLQALEAAGVAFSRDDLTAMGYYVTARKR